MAQLNGAPAGLNASLCQVTPSVGEATVKRNFKSVNLSRQTGGAPSLLFCRHFWPLYPIIFYSTLFLGLAFAGGLA